MSWGTNRPEEDASSCDPDKGPTERQAGEQKAVIRRLRPVVAATTACPSKTAAGSVRIHLRSAFVNLTSSSATCSIRCVIFLSVTCSPLKASPVAKANQGITTQRKSSMRLLAYAITDM